MNTNLSLNIDPDTFTILFDFLNDDIFFLYFLDSNNICVRRREMNFNSIDWDVVSHEQSLSPQMISFFKTMLNWNILTEIHRDDIEFIREFKDNIDFEIICNKLRFNDNDIFTRNDYEFCHEFSEYLHWTKLSRFSGIDELFIHKFNEHLNWNTLSSVQGLSEFILDTYHEKIVWENTSNNRAICTDLVNRFKPVDETDNEGVVEEEKVDCINDDNYDIVLGIS